MNNLFIEAANLTSAVAGLKLIGESLYQKSEHKKLTIDDLEALVQITNLVYKMADQHADNVDRATATGGD